MEWVFTFNQGNTMSETRLYPLDFNALQKGDVIPPEQIEKIYNVNREDVKAYQLKKLVLASQIERELGDRGRSVTVRGDGDSLRILTDPEAAEYNAKRFRHGLRAATRSHKRTMCVDVAHLDADQKLTHSRECVVQGKILQSIKDTKKALRLESHQRQTPGIEDVTGKQ